MWPVILVLAGLGEPLELPAAPPEQPPADPAGPHEVDGVVVSGRRPDVSRRIDRQVYSLKGDPKAESSPVIEALATLPSVTVTPTGTVLLLGQPGVAILIDGRRPRDVTIALRTLSGADVDRIEVMTNPSAQMSPEGSAGIINIITRKRRIDGVSGNVLVSTDTLGSVSLNATPSVTLGRWGVSGALGTFRDVSPASSERTRRFFDGSGAVIGVDHERRRFEDIVEGASGAISVTHKPSDNVSATLKIDADQVTTHGEAVARHDASGATGEPFIERGETRGRVGGPGVSFDFERTGPRAGETLAVQISASGSDWSEVRNVSSTFMGGRPTERFRAAWSFEDLDLAAKVDYRRPGDGDREFAASIEWSRLERTVANSFTALEGLSPDLNFARTIHGERDTVAVAGSYQSPFGAWTVLPALRLQARRQLVEEASVAAARTTTDWFPSLHVKRSLMEGLDLSASYSRRVDYPDVNLLSSAIQRRSATDASTGNPDLEPRRTDAFEVRMDYQRETSSVSLTAYARESSETWAWISDIDADGVRISRPINSGRGASRGAELSFRGDFGDRVGYVLTGNIFYEELRMFDGAVFREDSGARYTANGELNYTSPARGALEGDRFQATFSLYGPQRGVDSEDDGFFQADLTWRRQLTSKAAVTLSIADVFETATTHTRTFTREFDEVRDSSGRGRTVRLNLAYTLGGKRP